MQQAGESFLRKLAEAARARVDSGYYEIGEGSGTKKVSLLGSLTAKDRIPIIAEVKLRSPAEGRFLGSSDIRRLAEAYERGGAAGISVLTEPEHFDGQLGYLAMVKEAVGLPVMMKDVVVDPAQVEAGRRAGADAVLLIAGIFAEGMARGELDDVVELAHREGLEAVVEVHDEGELDIALSGDTDIVGVNNRDLGTLSVSTKVSENLLRKGPFAKPVICESGISTRNEIESLRSLGADGFLIGSALMKSRDPESTLRELSRL
jgi:indole-3-glycerol phosphate synthase